MEDLERLKQKHKELGEEIERLEKQGKQEKKWRAGKNEEYFFIDSEFDVLNDKEYVSNIDDVRYNMGNYFKTVEEAHAVVDKIKTYIELKDLAEELNNGQKIDWDNGKQTKFYIFFNHSVNGVVRRQCLEK